MDSSKQQVYAYLKGRILNCEFMPNDLIDQNELAKELNVSRTPVREAIAALEQEGLVVVLPRRGVLVANISFESIHSIYVVRELLEPYLVKQATHIADPEILNKYLDIFEQATSIQSFTQADFEFHKYLATLSQNRYLIQTMDNVLSHNMRFVILGSNIPERISNSNIEHAEIIHAMLERDSNKAEELMRKHIQFARKSCYDATERIK